MINSERGKDSSLNQLQPANNSIRAYVSDLICGAPTEDSFDAKQIFEEHPEILNHRSLVLDIAYEEYCRLIENGGNIKQKSFAKKFPEYEDSLLRVLQVHRYLENSESLAKKTNVKWPKPGDVFDDFLILELIGRGSFSFVFLAEQLSVGSRLVVLKVTRNALDEVKTLSQLSHPNIVEIYTVALTDDGFTAICMPLISQVTLFNVLSDLYSNGKTPKRSDDFVDALQANLQVTTYGHKTDAEGNTDSRSIVSKKDKHSDSESEATGTVMRIPRKRQYVDAVLQVGIDIADALEYSHSKDVYHCDIKPTNILIAPKGTSMLFDFNLSANSDSKTGRIGGTLPYMSPEQLLALADGNFDFEITASADIFSLGVTLFQLLTGKLPFGDVSDDESKETAARKLLENQKNTVVKFDGIKGLNASFKSLLKRCLSVDPGMRPNSANALAKELRREAAPLKRTQRKIKTHPIKFLSIVALLIALIPMLQLGRQFLRQLNEQQIKTTILDGRRVQANGQLKRSIEFFQSAVDGSEHLGELNFISKCYLAVGYARAGESKNAFAVLEDLKENDPRDQRLLYSIELALIASHKDLSRSKWEWTTTATKIYSKLKDKNQLTLDDENNTNVASARVTSRRPDENMLPIINEFDRIRTESEHAEANYNFYRYRRKSFIESQPEFANDIQPLLKAIAINGENVHYVSLIVECKINQLQFASHQGNIDKAAQWLNKLVATGCEKSVVERYLDLEWLDPIPSALSDIRDSVPDSHKAEPDMFHYHGVADPLDDLGFSRRQ